MVQDLVPYEISRGRTIHVLIANLQKLIDTELAKKSVLQAINDIKKSYESGMLVDCDQYHTIKTMKGLTF